MDDRARYLVQVVRFELTYPKTEGLESSAHANCATPALPSHIISQPFITFKINAPSKHKVGHVNGAMGCSRLDPYKYTIHSYVVQKKYAPS